IVIHSYGGPEVLTFEEVPDPVAGEGEILVKTVATSVNPFDLKIHSGAMKDFVPTSVDFAKGVYDSSAPIGVNTGPRHNFLQFRVVIGQGDIDGVRRGQATDNFRIQDPIKEFPDDFDVRF